MNFSLKKNEELVNQLNFLHREIAELKTRIQPHDTGHIHTTIRVLEDRVEEVTQQLIRV
jgi:hypothetical protein